MAIGEVIERAGPGAPWLTLVHGASQDRHVFSAQVEAFAGERRLLLVDLAGHGRASAVPGPYGLEEYTRGVLATMDAAGVAATDYWGTHTGAGVGLLIALREPSRVVRLVLEGPVLPGAMPPSVARNLERTRAAARRLGMEAARRVWFDESEWFAVIREHPERCRAAAQWAMISEFAGGPWLDDSPALPVEPVLDRLGAIDRPVLVVNGERDVPDFLESAGRVAHALPRARAVRIPGAGGFPLWECPDDVNARVRAFLDEASAS